MNEVVSLRLPAGMYQITPTALIDITSLRFCGVLQIQGWHERASCSILSRIYKESVFGFDYTYRCPSIGTLVIEKWLFLFNEISLTYDNFE